MLHAAFVMAEVQKQAAEQLEKVTQEKGASVDRGGESSEKSREEKKQETKPQDTGEEKSTSDAPSCGENRALSEPERSNVDKDGVKAGGVEKGKDENEISLDDVSAVPSEKKSVSCFNDGAFVSNVLEAIEELRLRRIIDCENEERIKTLVTSKHELQRKWDDEAFRSKEEKEKHENSIKAIRKQCEERLHQHENDKEKNQVASQCRDSEMNQLRDEVRALYLEKYNAEKKARELEREMQLQVSARKSHETQLSELDQKCKDAVKQGTEALELVDKVEANVSSASRLHKKLIYSNEHHKCLLNTCKEDLEARKQEIIGLKIAAAKQMVQMPSPHNDKGFCQEFLDKELRMQKELCRQYQTQLDESRSEAKSLSDSLKEAHQLVEKQVDIANKHVEMEAVTTLELDDLKSEHDALETSFKEEKLAKECLQEKMESQTKCWLEEKQNFEQQISSARSQHDALSQAHNALEEQVSKLSKQNDELTERVQQLGDETASLKIGLLEKQRDLEEMANELGSLKENYVKEKSSLDSQLAEAKTLNETNAVLIPQLREKISESEEQVESMFTALLDMRKETKHPITAVVITQTESDVTDESTQVDELDIDQGPNPVTPSHITDENNNNLANPTRCVDKRNNCKEDNNLDTLTQTKRSGTTNDITLGQPPPQVDGSNPEEQIEAEETSKGEQLPKKDGHKVKEMSTEVTHKEPTSDLDYHKEKKLVGEATNEEEKETNNQDTAQQMAVTTLLVDDDEKSNRSRSVELTKSQQENVLSTGTEPTTKEHDLESQEPSASQDVALMPSVSLPDPTSVEHLRLTFSPEVKHTANLEGIDLEDEAQGVVQDTCQEKVLDGCLKKRCPDDDKTSCVKRVRFNVEEGELYKRSKQGSVMLRTDSLTEGQESLVACSTPLSDVLPSVGKDETETINYGENQMQQNKSSGGPVAVEEEIEELFSDEEDQNENKAFEDPQVKEQIQRIQNLLNNDSLRTSRKRKHPEGQVAVTPGSDA